MKKSHILSLTFVLSFLNSFAFADWNSSPNEKPTWPLKYSEAGKDIDKLPELNNKVNRKYSEKNTKPDMGWSGGPSYTKTPTDGVIAPQDSEMPLSNKNLVEDDGVRVLSASMPPGLDLEEGNRNKKSTTENSEMDTLDSVRDWVAKEGMTLREILEKWSEVEGWEVAWNTKREYPLKASVIFRGRYKDVAAALIRTFSRATPQPHAKFFFGNKVLVIKTLEVNDAN